MTRAISALAIVLFANAASAEESNECLKNLGGAFYGVECYKKVIGNLSVAIETDIKTIKAMRKNPSYDKILAAYVGLDKNVEKFCTLPRDASAGWRRPVHEVPPTYIDSDVIFLECKYNMIRSKREYLQMIIKNAS